MPLPPTLQTGTLRAAAAHHACPSAPAAGAKVSEGITAMKGKVMAGINAYIAAHNLRSDDGA